MYLTKETIAIVADSTLASTVQYTNVLNGFIESIVYRPSTSVDLVLSTTSTIAINVEGTTDVSIYSGTIASTDMWRYRPRVTVHDSTGQTIGATTDYPVARTALANDRISFALTISTAEDLVGELDIYVEGVSF